jgi:hypothetical protein
MPFAIVSLSGVFGAVLTSIQAGAAVGGLLGEMTRLGYDGPEEV